MSLQNTMRLNGLVLVSKHPGPGQCDSCLLRFTDLHVGITKRLKTVEVLEGEDCNFECILSHEDIGDTAVWTVGGKTLGSSGRFQAMRQGRKYILAVREAVLGDTGEVVFSVRGLTSKASLVVRGGHHAPRSDRSSLLALPRQPAAGPGAGQPARGLLLGIISLSYWWGPRGSCVDAGGFWSSRGSVSRVRFSGLWAGAGSLVSHLWSNCCGSSRAHGH